MRKFHVTCEVGTPARDGKSLPNFFCFRMLAEFYRTTMVNIYYYFIFFSNDLRLNYLNAILGIEKKKSGFHNNNESLICTNVQNVRWVYKNFRFYKSEKTIVGSLYIYIKKIYSISIIGFNICP